MGRDPEGSVVSRVEVPVDLGEGSELVPVVASVPVHAYFLAVELATILRLVPIIDKSALALVVITVLVAGVGELAGYSKLAEASIKEFGADSNLKVLLDWLHCWDKI